MSGVPVINAMSDLEHPCQALADLLTVREHKGDLHKAEVAWVGDGYNVCHSLLLICGMFGVNLRVATPATYEPRADIVAKAQELAAEKTNERTAPCHGISGLITKHIALNLLQKRYRVRETVRTPAHAERILHTLQADGDDIARLSFAEADLNSDAGWTEAADGCTYVQQVALPSPIEQPRDRKNLGREGVIVAIVTLGFPDHPAVAHVLV